MDFVIFTNINGGREAFFAQDVKRVRELEVQGVAPKTYFTEVVFQVGSVMLRESYDDVMTKMVAAWGGEQA